MYFADIEIYWCAVSIFINVSGNVIINNHIFPNIFLKDFYHINAKVGLLIIFKHLFKQRVTIFEAGKGVAYEVFAAAPFVTVNFKITGPFR